MRTTLDIDDPILRELKSLQKTHKKSLGRLVSDLLALALKQHTKRPKREFQWMTRPMGARVDLADHEALLDAMDEAPRKGKSRR